MIEALRNRRAIAAVGLSVGALILGGCGDERGTPAGGSIRLSPEGTLYIPGESEGKFSEMTCDGTTLKQKIEVGTQAGERDVPVDRHYKYPNDPACEDQKLTIEDFTPR